MKKTKPTPEELHRMHELGYYGRKGQLNTPSLIKEAETLWKKYPKEYAEQTGIGRKRADDEVNPFS